MCISFVAVGRSLTIVSYVAFKMAALWFWTMFNCNPPIAHCHPLLWGGGILVDLQFLQFLVSSVMLADRKDIKWILGVLLYYIYYFWKRLTHWGRVTHICVIKLTIIGSYNGLSSGRRQAIIWANVGILLIWPLGTNFSEILIEINTFSFKKMHLKMSYGKWQPFVSASVC